MLMDIVEFHAEFENIHPFQDGNGRVGRMILLKQCLDADIIPIIIQDNNKAKYYRYLNEAQTEHVYAGLLEFFKEEQKDYQSKVRPLLFDYEELENITVFE